MDFDLTDDQKMLARTVAQFGKTESTVERFRKLRDADGIGWDRATWKQMGELGWLGVAFSEDIGGFGGTFVEAATILEGLGKTLVPEPYLESIVLGGYALGLGGDQGQRERFLAPMVAGDTTVALAWAENERRYDFRSPKSQATRSSSGWKLVGEKHFVLNGHAAEQLVVSAMGPSGVELFVVDASDTTRAPLKLIDGRRAARVAFDVEVGDDRRLAAAPAPEVLDRVIDYGAAAAVAEGVGVASTMLTMTIEYLKTREQFGVPIGTFQALQHRAVDMFVEVELLRSIAMETMVRADEPDPRERRLAISAAKHQLAAGATFVSRQAIQLHGGIGVTDEHDIGLYFKRMHALTAICGDEAFHAARYHA